MKLKLLIAAIGVAVSSFAIADSYQSEISVDASRIDQDGIGSKIDRYDLEGTYYFNAVNTTNLPLAESAYLGKNSNVFANLIDWPRQHGDKSAQEYQVGAEFYIPESFLYVKAGGIRQSSGNYRNNDWFTTIGVTPINGLLLTTEYRHDEGYDANLHAKYVTSIGNGQFINVEAGAADTDGGSTVELGGDFYFDNTFSVGGQIVDYDGGTDYSIRTRKFFSEKFSGDLSYTDGENENVVSVGLNLRF